MQDDTRLRWLDMMPEEISSALEGQPKFRAKQVFSQLHMGKGIDQMSNLPKELRATLCQTGLGGVRIVQSVKSAVDDTQKFLFELEDGNVIEGVFMRYKHGNTLCISTQVGCRMGCTFCASTIGSLERNLYPGEMLGQVLAVEALYGKADCRAITNVVMMGSGEPLDNYDNCIKFLLLLNHPDGINISLRNVSLSTCGLVERMVELADSGLNVTLSLSLHAPNDALRQSIMPIAKKHSLSQVLGAVRYYVNKTKRRAILEYALIEGVNDTNECIEELARILRGFQCHVNLIPLNGVKESGLEGTSRGKAHKLADLLTEKGISATVRREMGADIEGACGQLRRRYLSDDADNAGEQGAGSEA